MKKIVNIFASVLLMFMVCQTVKAQEPAAVTYSYDEVSFCHGGSVTYKGRVYTEQGRDTLKYQSSTGEDSLVVLTIYEYPNYHFDQTVHIQQDSSYNWMGSTYSVTGTYTKVYTTVYGCDSIYTLNLIVDQSYAFHDSASVCLGEIYEWQGKKINEGAAGKYQYEVNYISQSGVDSTYYLTLTVLPVPHSQEVLVLCPGEQVTFMGKTYTQAGRDVIVVPSVTGCDSTIEVVIKANPSYHFNDTIHIKEGSTYTWHGQTYDQTGTYLIEDKTIEGCDSTYSLTLFVDPNYEIYKDTTVCLGSGFSWNKYYINAQEPGEKDYDATLVSVYGTDSIVHLHVTVLPRIVEYKQLYFCHGGGVTYNGHTYTQAGRDTLVYQSHLGCDSLLVLTIYENPSYQFYDTIYLAKGETITWHKQSITEFKTYTDAYQTVNGCDSIYTLVVYEKPSYQFYQDTTICFGETLEWQNRKISEEKAGTYSYTANYSSQYGTDSIYHLNLTILPKYWTIQQLSICDGTNVSFNGKTYTQSGRDTLYYTSALGCDSVVEVIINAKTPLYFKDTIRLEEGTSLDWRGKTITEGGSYTDEYGCDSIFMLFVQMVHVDHFYQNATICEGEKYTWEGKDYTKTGDYTATYKNMAGNDSIMHLHLTVSPKSWVIKHFSLCQGSTIEYNGKTYNKAGRDTITFTSTLGCDSVEEVIVIETYPFHHYDTLKLEAGTTTEWHGQTISAGGIYKDENTTVAGCDSIYELYVQLYYVDHIYKDTTICYGETYTWEGETFNVSGEYVREKRFTNQAGTDSIMHLHLVILPEYKIIKSFTLCHGSTIEYNGKTYTTAGRDTLHFTSGHGCDSIVEVIVTESYPFYQYDTIRLEEGTTTQWRGQTISEGRTYADEHKMVNGCDSIYYLTVQMVHVDHTYQNASICEGDSYSWEGQSYNTPGDYTASYKNQAGNDSIVHLHLTVSPKSWVIKHFSLCQGSTIEYNGKTYSKAGRDTITFTSSTGCDSIEEVIVTEVYPFHQYDTIQLEAGTTTEWRGQTISEGRTYTDAYTTVAGCDSIYELYVQLYYVDHIYKDTTICYGETYTWQGETFTESGEYIREKAFKNIAGTDSIMHLHLTILPKYWTIQNLTFCHNKSITFNGKTYTEPGRDTVYMTSLTGCDSIIEVIISESPVYAFYDTVTIWDTETYEWVGHGQTITGSGDYKDEHISVGGCDSTYYLKVYVQHKDDIHETATICYGDSIVWQGNTYKEVGVHHYEVTYTNQYGNDSTMHLHLTILPKYWQQQPLFFCHGTSVSYNGKTYNQERKDTIYYNSINGCDSIIELIIKEYPTYLYQDTVHLQQGKELNWHSQTITQGGVYEDKQMSIYGCDSTYVLVVIEDKVYSFHEKANACVNQTFEWQGLQINESEAGVYTYDVHYTTVQGADSAYYLELTVYPSYFEQKQFFICRGESVTFNNHVYSQPGRDTIRLLSATGCDSLIEVIVDEYPSYIFNQTVHIKKDSSYTWNGKILTQSGKYYKSYSTIHGCDSTYTLTLIVDSAYTFHDTAVSCLGDIYEWQGLKISEAAAGQYNYKVNYATQYGMDSTYYLTLTVREKPFSQQVLSICPGENVTFHNKNYSKAGRDTILLPAANGCDSVIEVIINEYESYRYNDTVHIKKDSSYTWHDQQYSETGTYVIQGTTVYGCDSTYTLTLIVDSAYHFYEKADLCVNEVYEWQGLIISKDSAGVYTYTKPYTSIYGMDSVYHLTIDIHPVYKAQQHLYFCAGDSVAFHGKIYKQPGKDTIHLQSAYGCDSLIEVIVNEYPTYHFQQTKYIKEGDTFEWQGKTITEEGVYDAHYNTVNGCDSSYTITVIKIRDYEYWETAHSCVGETFLWQGLEINEKAAGTYEYTQKYVSQFSTDSVYHLTLTVDSAYVQYQYLSFCEGGFVTFGDSTYTQSGTDTLRFQGVGGCDSTIIVVITAQKRFFTTDTIELSNNETYLWHGQTITQSGTYRDVQTTASGCDSIYELVAFFYPTYLFEDSVAICQSEAPYIWRLNDTEIPLNHEAGQTKIYEQRYETVNHKDSIYRLILTILPEYEITIPVEICEGSYYEYKGHHYTTPGTYSDTLRTIYGCDSIVHFQVNVLPKYLKVDTAYLSKSHPTYTWSINDSTFTKPTVFAINNKTIAGCDSINRLVLLQAQEYIFPIEHDTLCSSGHDAIVWHNKTLTESGIYYDSLFTVLGEDSIYSIELAVFPTYDTTISVTICEVELPYLFNNRMECTETGTYLDTLHTIHGCDSVVRLELNVLPRVTEVTTEVICETDLAAGYYFHGMKIINEGMYVAELQPEAHCNSVAELYLRLKPDLMESDSVVICAGETYVLGRAHDPAISIQYNGITVQPMKDTVIWGCDNIHYFKIFVRNEKDTTVNMCENDSLWLPGTKRWVYAVPNAVYMDTIKTNPDMFTTNPDSVLCDSLVRWTIGDIYPTYHPDTVVMHISDHDSILWGGKYRTATGIYNDTTKTVGCGCDSIVTLSLIVDKTYSFRDSIHICQPHDVAYQHTWSDGHVQSQAIWNAGVYTDSLRTKATADLYKYYARDYKDSVYTLVVTMDPSYFFPRTISLCQGDSVELGGKWITKAGVYTDSLTTANGCDSIYQWVVNMTQSYYFRETKSIAQGTTYTWHGRQLVAPGTYYDSLQTVAFDCDSIYELTLNVYPTYHFITDTTICECQTPYLWHDQMIYESGTYFDKHQTVHHFDSIYELRLQVKDTSHVRINASTCEGDSILFDGQWLTQSGVYYDTTKNSLGCDSIIEFVYTQKRSYLFEQVAQTDDQHPYIWTGHKDEEGNDMTFTTSGLYQDKHKTIDGCDSIYRLTLTVYPTYHFDTLKHTICASEAPYYWAEGQRDCANSGIYTARYSTVNGYDSIYVLNLTVLPTLYGTERLMICEGDSAVYNGHTYKTQGTFYDTLTNPITGCDSIVSVIVSIAPKYYFKESAQTDDQHPYTWMEHKGNIVYSRTGVYYDSLTTVTGCDSIYELTLTVYPTYHFDTLKHTICASEAPYYWAEGQRDCANSGIYTARYSTVNGYDSIYVLNLTVLPTLYGTERLMICEGDSAVYNGHTYKTQGTFYDTLTNPITGCDSIVSVIVSITPKYYFKESAQTDDQHPYTWMEHKGNIVYSRTGVYYDSLTTVMGCDSIYELTLTVYPTYHFDTLKHTICASDAPYYWAEGQRDCANSGIYTARYSTVNGYDSIYVLDLTVNPTLQGEMSVTICEGDFFLWKGDSLRVGGNYTDTLPSRITGCDSIVTLHLFVKESYLTQINKTIFAGDSVIFEGDTLWHSGQYEKRYSTADTAHCDSIIQLNLIVKPVYYRDTTVTICESELPYRWNWHNNEAFYTGGTYIRTSITDEGKFCDTLHLNVDEQHIKTIQTFICEGDSLRYRNKLYTSSGTFYDTIPAVEGCDTIYKIVIGVYPNSTQYLTVHISEKEKYSFGQTVVDTIKHQDGTIELDTIHTTRILDRSGTYYDYNKNIFGCDSVTVLTLIVHPSITENFNVEICDNELPHIFGSRKIWQSGTYTDSLYTKEGYDSIVILNLTVLPTYHFKERYEISEGTHTFIRGQDISEAGIYYDSLKTKSGCDSVYEIIVDYKHVIWKEECNVTICQGDTFKFYGKEYTNTGTYNYTSPDGDSLVIAHLTVLETKYTRIEKLLCSDGDSTYFYRGKDWKAPIVFRDTFKTVEGCDSIVTLDLRITEKFSEWDERPLCKGDTVIIQGDTIFKPGDYELVRKSKSGKNDSIYRVSFYEAPNFEVSVVDTICQGDTLWVGSIPVTRAGIQTLNPKTVDGCDSIVHLNLTINPSYFNLEKATTVDYIPFQWRGKSYNESGTYYDVLPTIHNCDSTFALELKVIDTYRVPEDREICIGSTTLWRGKEYSEPGFYSDTVCNIASYTSIIYTLNLSIIVPTEIQSATILTQEICADSTEIVFNVQHTGATPQTYSVYFDARAHHEGFVDIKDAKFITPGIITISIPELGVPANPNHMRYVRPGNYTVTIELNNGVCGVSKSKPVEFQVRYPSWILEQNWSNVVAVLAKDYNGGFEFSQYAWSINNAPMEGTEAYIRNDFLAQGDSVVAYLTRVGEDYSIPTCPLIIAAPAPDVYPTPVLQVEPTSAPVTSPRFVIKSQMGGDYNIYTMMGQPLGQGKFEQGQHELMLPAMVGHYVIYVSQEDGTKKAQHVIVY